jgi:hypothetical protein
MFAPSIESRREGITNRTMMVSRNGHRSREFQPVVSLDLDDPRNRQLDLIEDQRKCCCGGEYSRQKAPGERFHQSARQAQPVRTR